MWYLYLMNTTKTNPLAGSRNPELAAAMRGKAGNLTHADRRTKRNRTRSSQRRNAIKESS